MTGDSTQGGEAMSDVKQNEIRELNNDIRTLREMLQTRKEYWVGYADAEAELAGEQPHKAEVYAAAPALLAALIALRDAVKNEPAMNNRKYDGLGIQVNNAIRLAGR